jgi:phytoene/squalene synthetase
MKIAKGALTELNYNEQDLVAAYEELYCLPESERIMEYYGDFCIFVVKSRTSKDAVDKRLNEALSAFHLSREEFNNMANAGKFTSRHTLMEYLKKHC